MQTDSSVFQVPGMPKPQANNFATAEDDFSEIYEELTAISEEIERCRLKNS